MSARTRLTTMRTSRLAAFLFTLATFATMPALAQKFGTSVNLYPHGVASISNNPIVHASGNNVYVAFSDTTTVSDIHVRISTDNGTTWGTTVKASNDNTHPNIEPVIVGDGTTVHVFWTDDVAGENPNGANAHVGRIFYARGTQSGTGAAATVTFAAPVVLVDQPGYSRPTSALIDAGGKVHLVFYDNRAITGFSVAGRVFHMLSCNGGANWTIENNVTQFDGDVDNEQPRIAQLTTGEVFVSFRSSRGGLPQGGWPPFEVYLLRMGTPGCGALTSGAPNTTTWNYPAQLLSRGTNVDQGGNYAANLFTGSAGGLHAAWWNDTNGTNLVYRYGKPNGAGFGAQQDVSGFGVNHLQWTRMTERTGMGIGEDATGQVHAIFLQNGSTRGPEPFQVGSLWYNCSLSPGSGFLGKQLMGGASLASEPRAFYSNNRLHVVWMDFRNTAIEQAEIFYNFVNTTVACAAPPAGVPPVPSTSLVDFGGNSMQTTSFGQTFQLTNGGGAAVSISSLTPSAGFTVSATDCVTTLSPGASCNVTLVFTPGTQGTINGTLSVATSSGTLTVNLTGVGELSLVTHYYNSILNRAPDASGKAFWDGEASRLQSLGADPREAYVVMANYFFHSAEYLSYGKNDAQFVTDLYNTFFNRPPDAGGLAYWTGQISGGLPRDVVLFSFMFSPEFQTFTTGIFGSVSARPEVNMVMDLFRGILNRLPDSAAYTYWVGQLKTAQCTSGGAVYTAVDNMSYTFIFGAEYTNRARNNMQYVTDEYNAFLRRGGDITGVNFWINQLNTSALDRNGERGSFINSPEFGARVTAVINAGCVP